MSVKPGQASLRGLKPRATGNLQAARQVVDGLTDADG